MLSDSAVRQAKPGAKACKLFDGGGLYLLIAPTGGKLWRLKYRFEGREKLLALGAYPDVALKQAREARDEARKILAAGIDPGAERKAAKAALINRQVGSFEAVAREWFEKFSPAWAPSHAATIIRRLERDVFPWLGGPPVGDITAVELLEVLRRVEARGAPWKPPIAFIKSADKYFATRSRRDAPGASLPVTYVPCRPCA
jgi:hypothetical protein